MATMAARMSRGWLARDSWKARAVPWKLPWTEVGTPRAARARSSAWAAWPRETPSGRLKLMVEAGKPLWWFTTRGVLVVSMRAKAARGTWPPPGVVKRKAAREAGFSRWRGQFHHHPVLVQGIVDGG